ncbi:hypothetical protein ASPACDRAFT_42832 [Aspergillus aculeatus ATCC 16872]|uniref:Aminotransferase class V domain-containing protein n=1 Tax=Aspergillus aculeatus (strain ATCC 16872 / CBS 172.66 / WB 5094) TaxID=690307 RepID=A0A1L9WVE4_ASPA1|nr:uncharacterized protein ASPACDRAFT_42832 [Aspergillus aculeatus ATCC 16872]OJK00247.1 hypothetical protein ASPACDRAFT_42832 [Aspergillus aculeatus ATCC 16872]
MCPGISARLAQQCSKFAAARVQASSRRLACCFIATATIGSSSLPDSHPVYEELRDRISRYAQSPAADPQMATQAAASDVFLYGSEMAAIYHVHQSISVWKTGLTVQAGLPPKGQKYGRTVSGRRPTWMIWPPGWSGWDAKMRAGCKPSADQHDVLVIVDDSVASFANVDLMGVADIVVFSLSKYFSGYADMATTHENSLFVDDAIGLERNSRDFSTRMARINVTTEYLVSQLVARVADPTSPLTRVLYPSLSLLPIPERTTGLAPGAGATSMSFADVGGAAAFFDYLDVYKELSFGADVCIAAPYMQMTGQVSQKQQQQQQQNDTSANETLVRCAVGVEQLEEILQRVPRALDAASLAFTA